MKLRLKAPDSLRILAPSFMGRIPPCHGGEESSSLSGAAIFACIRRSEAQDSRLDQGNVGSNPTGYKHSSLLPHPMVLGHGLDPGDNASAWGSDYFSPSVVHPAEQSTTVL